MKSQSSTNEALVLSGLTELAIGAVTGWPYALAIDDPDKVRKLRIRSVPRLRQWHLDLIALGGLSVLIGTAVPNLPRWIAGPLAVGAWTNANAFGVLALRPDWKEHPVYKSAVGGSFATVSGSFSGPGDPRRASPAALVSRRPAHSRCGSSRSAP